MDPINNRFRKFGKARFICECPPKRRNFGKAFAFYQRDPLLCANSSIEPRTRAVSTIIYSPYDYIPNGGGSMCCFNERQAEIIETFIESNDPKQTQALSDFVCETFKANNLEERKIAFKKLESTYEHNLLNKSKLAEVRIKLAKKIDNTLGTELAEKKLPLFIKKIEKRISDKVLGKDRG